ncbi:hypothetical protein BSKO_12494 [Bryopsis sp. KO-2023]|nr:hypothetical protein BSKO_12494 [Bryopsis sp. KO-2023]
MYERQHRETQNLCALRGVAVDVGSATKNEKRSRFPMCRRHKRLPAIAALIIFSVLDIWRIADAQQCGEIFPNRELAVSKSTLDSVGGDLQTLIDCAPDGGTLTFAAGLLVNSTEAIVLTKPIKLTSKAFGEKRPKFRCPDGSTPIFEISSLGVELSNLIVSDCDLQSKSIAGVVVDVPENATEPSEASSGMDFLGNRNVNGTGAVYIIAAKRVEFDSVNFLENVGFRGGGVTLNSTGLEADFKNCLFEGNNALNEGAAINQNSSTFLTISGCDFRHNSGVGAAGALHIKGEPPQSSLEIVRSNFLNNTAAQLVDFTETPEGGAILAKGPTLNFKMKSCVVEQSKAIFQGGALKIVESRRPGKVDVEIDDTVFKDNVGLEGGAIHLLSARKNLTMTISNSHFLRNRAKFTLDDNPEAVEMGKNNPRVEPSKGGAIYMDGSGIILISRNNTFDSNRVEALGGPEQKGAMGGAIFATDIREMRISDTVFANNTSENLDTLGLKASAGAVAIQAVGVAFSRVLEAPEDSECASQCSGADSEKFGITNVIEGCGEGDTPDSRICVLKNATKCDAFPIKSFQLQEEDKLAALCTIERVNTTVSISKSRFIDNAVIHGHGGALSLTEKALVVSLEPETVQFTGNSARNGSGGALNVASGARVLGSRVVFKDNQAEANGGAISVQVPKNATISGSIVNIWVASFQGIGTGLSLSNSNFSKNRAMGSGGAIWADAVDMKISLNEETVLEGNSANDAGGAVAVFGGDGDVKLTEIAFKKNKARTAGGALRGESFSERIQVRMSDVTFDDNGIDDPEFPGLRAGKGGAVSLEGAGMALTIGGESSSFTGNTAREGGAIRLFDASRVKINNTTFSENVGLSGGGMHVSFTTKSRGKSVRLTDVRFIENNAFMGGGVLADALSASESFIPDDGLASALFARTVNASATQIVLDGVEFKGHSVVKDGGGLMLIDGRATCRECVFSENVVTSSSGGGGGGAVKLEGAASFEMEGGKIENNRAGNGGGVLVENALFTGKGVEIVSNTAFQSGGGFSVEATEGFGDLLLRLDECVVNGNAAHIGGGIHSSVESLRDSQNVDVRKVEVISCDESIVNEGNLPQNIDLGGGFEDVVSLVGDVCESQVSASAQSSPAAKPAIELNQTTLMSNFADRAGGALFANEPGSVCVCCEGSCSSSCTEDGRGVAAGSFVPKSRAVDASLETVCVSLWTQNGVGDGGYGPKIASLETKSDVVSPLFRKPLKDQQFFVHDHQSGHALGELTIRLKDSFGQVVTTTGPDLFVRVVADDATILSGQVDKQVERGEAKFDSIIVTGRPQEYLLNVTFPSSAKVPERQLRMHVRSCRRGEKERKEDRASDGRIVSPFTCELCADKTYSFDAKSCMPCPELAECDGKTIVPEDGHWHSSSWSPEIHDCLVEVACKYPQRANILLKNSTDEFQRALGYDEGYALCHEGYEGVLCGSCAKGYGRARAFECEKCISRQGAMAIFLIVLLWMVGVVGFLIRNALSAGTPISSSFHGGGQQEGVNGVVQAGQPQIQLVVNATSENAKILLNFLQVTSIALVVNVKWRREVREMLVLADVASGFSANGGIFSIDCALDHAATTPVSIQRSLVTLSIPFGLMALFAVFWRLDEILDEKLIRRPDGASHVQKVALLVNFYWFMAMTWVWTHIDSLTTTTHPAGNLNPGATSSV